MLPHEPGLLFYWFKYKDSDGQILFYVAEGDTRDGSGKIWSEPPRVGVEEEKYPYA